MAVFFIIFCDFSLMLMYNNFMGIVLEEEQKGFTIIEVMLFLALSGFLLAGILAGTGASIANQRYKDAVQDAVDALRSAYSFVADTQIESRDGKGACGGTIDHSGGVLNSENNNRGRTECAVYGAVVMIDGARIQMTSVIGRDYFDFIRAADDANAAMGKGSSFSDDLQKVLFPNSDIDLLKGLHVNNLAYQCGNAAGTCNTIGVAGGAKTLKLKWGTSFRAPRDPMDPTTKENKALRLTLLIYRHPINGSIRTLSMDKTIDGSDGQPIDYSKGVFTDIKSEGIYSSFGSETTPSPLEQKNIYLCVDSDSIDSYADHRRIIKIVKNAHSQSGIVLTDMDEDVYDGDEEVLCDDI